MIIKKRVIFIKAIFIFILCVASFASLVASKSQWPVVEWITLEALNNYSNPSDEQILTLCRYVLGIPSDYDKNLPWSKSKWSVKEEELVYQYFDRHERLGHLFNRVVKRKQSVASSASLIALKSQNQVSELIVLERLYNYPNASDEQVLKWCRYALGISSDYDKNVPCLSKRRLSVKEEELVRQYFDRHEKLYGLFNKVIERKRRKL